MCNPNLYPADVSSVLPRVHNRLVNLEGWLPQAGCKAGQTQSHGKSAGLSCLVLSDAFGLNPLTAWRT